MRVTLQARSPSDRAGNVVHDLAAALLARVRQTTRGDHVPATRPESIAYLVGAFSPNGANPETVAIYLRALSDIPPAELEQAAEHLVETQTERWLPAVGEIRRLIFERRLQLPSPLAALELVEERLIHHPVWATCPECEGRADLDAVCPSCRDEGRIDTNRPEPLPEPLRRALTAVGGLHALAEHDAPSVWRSQFVKAYTEFRGAAIRAASGENRALAAGTPQRELAR